MTPLLLKRHRRHPKRRTMAAQAVVFVAALLAVTAGVLSAHDLFLRPTRFFVPENSEVEIHVLNGTFSKSEGAVTRDRLRALDMISPAGVTPLDTSQWVPAGDTTVLTLRTGSAGTYVVGASLRPRELRLEAKDFNNYLATDGVPDVLEARRQSRDLDKPARERYHKHVKAVLQVGRQRSGGFDRALGYPAELVPLDNPYDLRRGASLRVRALVDGRPVANQYVVTGGRGAGGARIAQRGVRTDVDGVARVPLRSAGVWYAKFIHMARASGDTTIDYESKWATLTFQVR
ncbi:MAG: DUF4198 domain-containing protein [Gemmatimonadota bacterium]|nr:DUF4198 domain-containing protein [Gemmatimonadota bacterium]